MNNENAYKIVSVDSDNKRVFVSRRPIVTKSEDEKLIMGIDQKFDVINFDEAGSKLSDYEVVDTTDWEYGSYEELSSQIYNYEPKSKGK